MVSATRRCAWEDLERTRLSCVLGSRMRQDAIEIVCTHGTCLVDRFLNEVFTESPCSSSTPVPFVGSAIQVYQRHTSDVLFSARVSEARRPLRWPLTCPMIARCDRHCLSTTVFARPTFDLPEVGISLSVSPRVAPVVRHGSMRERGGVRCWA